MIPPTVSVVIPTYNAADRICRAIDSVLAQTCQPLEIVVIDDGSEDDTPLRIAAYDQRQTTTIVYRRTSNKGAATARNLGNRTARGDYVLLLDADDRLLPDGIALLMNPILKDFSLDAVIGGCYSINATGKRKYRPAPALSPRKINNFRAYIEGRIAISHGRFLVRKCFFNRVQYPASFRSSEDISVFALILATCNSVSVDRPVAEIFHHAASLRNNPHHALDVGLKVVDAVFDERSLPANFFVFRPIFLRKRCLSLFRTLYRAGEYAAADRYYRQAIRESITCLLKWSYLFKYIRMRLKMIVTHEVCK
jgi:glycosyltransferase involved in cell wall biosynthesis